MHTHARRKVSPRNQWSQGVDTKRTPLSLHYLILMCHLKNIKQSFVTENAAAREFHYECKHDVQEYLLRQPATAKWNRNAISFGGQTVSVKAAPGDSDRLTFTPSARESTNLLVHIFTGSKHFLFTHVPWDNQSVGDDWFIDASCPISFPVTFCIDSCGGDVNKRLSRWEKVIKNEILCKHGCRLMESHCISKIKQILVLWSRSRWLGMIQFLLFSQSEAFVNTIRSYARAHVC